MTISSPGLGSNLDVNGIVSQLMALESRPLVVLAQRAADYQTKLSIFGQIKSMLSSFQSAAKGLTTASAADAFTASVSNSTVLSAQTSETATVSSHNITVSAIAKAQQLVAAGQTDAAAAIGSGSATTLTLSFGTISGGTLDSDTGLYSGASFTENTNKAAISIQLDGTNNSLEGIRDAINAAGAGVTASIVNDGSGAPYRLSLAVADTGADNSLRIDVSGDATLAGLLAYDPAGTQNLSQTQAASDAQLTLDGIGISSATNVIEDAVEGLTLTLLSEGDATVSVSRSTYGIRSALEALVKSYNDANKAIADATAFQATLQGDASARSAQYRLRAAIGSVHADGSRLFSTLSQLGVSFQPDGSLAFDSSDFDAAVAEAPTDARKLVAAFGASLTQIADALVADNGPMDSRTDGIQRSLDDIAQHQEQISLRLELKEKGLRAQFSALDSLISSMLQTSNFLQQQLANLPKISNS